MTAALTEGTTYTVTYLPTTFGKPVTRKGLTLRAHGRYPAVIVGYTGKRTYRFVGPKGGVLVLGEDEIVRFEAEA